MWEFFKRFRKKKKTEAKVVEKLIFETDTQLEAFETTINQDKINNLEKAIQLAPTEEIRVLLQEAEMAHFRDEKLEKECIKKARVLCSKYRLESRSDEIRNKCNNQDPIQTLKGMQGGENEEELKSMLKNMFRTNYYTDNEVKAARINDMLK